MSIEIIGQQKYRFQDHVCALLAVLASGNPGASLQIEPKDGEDALLQTTEGGVSRTVEVQVKGAIGAITHDVLAIWLAHYPAHGDSGSLLERISSDSSRSVLFVASGRCNDAVVPHAVPLSVRTTQVPKGVVTNATERGMREGLRNYETGTSSTDSELVKRRRANIGEWLVVTPAPSLKTALQRVLIAELLDEPEVLRRIRDNLEVVHRVVPDRVEEATRRITEIVVNEKKTGVNLMPQVDKVISWGSAVDPLVAASYISRGEEDALLDRLSLDSALLLTGAPRVGKTSCARNLAHSLQSQGYSVRICTDISEAERYLTEPVTGNRAALVDDPLGGAHAADNAARELMLMGALIPKLTNGRRLIVSQAQDRLLQISRCQSVSAVRTGNLPWVEMSIGANGFLGGLWSVLTADYSVPQALGTLVAEAIEAGQLDLEPGCLVYLAANHDRVSADAQLADVISYARQDSKSLGDALREEQLAPLMSALAIASTPSLRSAELELAFVLDDKRSDRPGESNVKGILSSWPSLASTTPPPPPSYVPLPALSAQQIGDLDRLELRRMVNRASRRYTFSHPFYRASAESLVDAATTRSMESALSALERALFTLDADASCAAAANLGWIHRNLNTEEGRQGIVGLAVRGLNSIFPAVRDLCFEFLARRLQSLSVEDQAKVPDWVQSVTFMRLSSVEWTEDGQPRIPSATVGDFLEVDTFPASVSQEEVADALALLDSERPDTLSARDAARTVMFFQAAPGRLTLQMASRLLSFDISMVRAPVARLWIGAPRDGDQLLLQRIFNEQHPSVTEAAYQGVLEAWPECGEARRAALISGLQVMADSPISAAVLIGGLVVIARTEYGGPETPWPLFEALMPRVLRQLPPGASFRDERLYDVMDAAIGNISNQSLLEIIDCWIELVHQYALSGTPSDYMLGVTDILISGVPSETGERGARIERLLAVPGTASRIRVVVDLVDAWDDLKDVERVRLLQHLTTADLDVMWLQAAALTRRDVPSEIQKAFLPARLTLASAPEEIASGLPASLLEACVHVFTGHHPVIYYVGAHGSRNTAWNSVLRRIVRMPEHSMFEVAWEWLSFMGEEEELAEVAHALGVAHAERLAGLLLERKQHTSGEFMADVWTALFRLPVSQDVKSDWLARMAALAPNALDSLDEHKSWIPESHRDEFLSHFESDDALRKLAVTLLRALNFVQGGDDAGEENEAEDEELAAAGLPVKSQVLKLIEAVVDKYPPKHWQTYDIVLSFIELGKFSDDVFKKKVQELRSRAIELSQDRPARRRQTPMNWEGRF
ncbi:hypothetical protein CCL15_07555 [Pseudomonas syringae]|uniref:nSTAND3 domain-containing NTPase n=1 Tax=Pseudomonas syringae TaxID=317 RepID=UPI000BB5C193|nr:hypothetical protein [Pseudomonas syringae]PBP69292.1 hypothetical protein CCL15_16330 [Pseudomonas syringae]PBP73726.1 hypothetical protein CCL15_07555 [Pseudomonas syringae]